MVEICIVCAVTPEIRDVGERFTAMRRQVIHPSDIGMTIGLGTTQLRARLQEAGIEVLGPPYARYHSWEKDAADVEVGFEVAAPVELDDVGTATLQAGREAVAVHHGPYAGIPKTFAALEQWVNANAVQTGIPREVYLSNADEVPMDDRMTEIVFPIA